MQELYRQLYMSVNSNILFNQSMKSLDSYFRDRPIYENIGSVLLLLWFVGGMIEDGYLYIFSMIFTTLILVIGLVHSIHEKLPIGNYSSTAFYRLFIGLWANEMYTNGKTPGDISIFVGITISVNLIAGITTSSYAIMWLISKNFDKIDMENFFEINTFYLIIKSITRSIILIGLLYSVFTSHFIIEPYNSILFYVFIIDPIVSFIQSQYDKTLDPIQLNFGSAKLPTSALRDSMISNSIILLFTISFKGLTQTIGKNSEILPEKWKLLRTGYILLTALVFVAAMDTIKKYNSDPLSQSDLGTLINHTQLNIDNIILSEKVGYVLDKNAILKLNNTSTINIDTDSIIIPLSEYKNKIEALIIGKTESQLNNKGEFISEFLDGVTTAIIPIKEFSHIKDSIVPRRMDLIDLDILSLPSLDQLSAYIDQLAIRMDDWLQQLKTGLSAMKLSDYGISTMPEGTHVRLPGITVLDGKNTTKVSVFGVDILETPKMSSVRIGKWLHVLELPKFSLVSLPGITILELAGTGSAVDILGFKISDGIDATRLDEFKRIMLEQMNTFNKSQDNELGKILVDKNASALMNISWNNEFKSLLGGKKNSFNGYPKIGNGNIEKNKLLKGNVNNYITLSPKFIELTGLDKKREKKSRKSEEKENAMFEDIQSELAEIKNEIYGEDKNKKLDKNDTTDYQILDE